MNAPASAVHALVDDFREWTRWSPWEGLDPDLKRTYSGPEAGVGSTYAWEGNAKAGTGTMKITSSTAQRIEIALEFLKPFKASNVATFSLAERDGATEVDWTMSGQRNLVFAVLGRLLFDRAIAKDFDKGLAALKAAAEA